MQHRTMGAALLTLAIAASPLAMAAGKKDRAAAKKAPVEQPVVTDVAPPSGSWEAAPPPNKDYVWSKGYYEWKDGRYQWTAGEWVLKKEGMEYAQREWVKRPDGKFELTGGKFVPEGQAGKEAAEAKAGAKDAKTSDAKNASDARRMGAGPAAKR